MEDVTRHNPSVEQQLSLSSPVVSIFFWHLPAIWLAAISLLAAATYRGYASRVAGFVVDVLLPEFTELRALKKYLYGKRLALYPKRSTIMQATRRKYSTPCPT